MVAAGFVCCVSKSPLAVAENGDALSILGIAVDVHALAADHEILVDEGVVDADLLQFRLAVLLVARVALIEARAQRRWQEAFSS